ncbi:PREDICTED: OX-2 membrane glycoprotein isoform X3 [Ficedula albicollis]|uniref:OX-2 membrane glycoprotein isoform X3 n=1 Tax=Ficedula albicollis TaxID=59894 RepID=UPI00035A08A5|nr:PREDICTED: OX-2 membrane glycoprotein isoform X3 [Ficedula albicollis]
MIVIENSSCLQVKQIFSSKMTLRVLVLCLAYSGLGKADVVPQAGHTEVRMGDNATLSCALTKSMDVLQVTWQKDSEGSNDNIATYSKANGLKIHEPYKGRMNFTSLELNKTSITFWDTRMDDSGHYKCLFNVFPVGSLSGNIHLSVSGLNASVHHNISEDHLIVTCNAYGFPEPTITWNNLFNSTPTQKTVKHKNGIVSITSKLEVYNIQSISARDLTCTVSNTNEAVELPVKIKGGRRGIISALVGDYCSASSSHHSSDYALLEEDPMQDELKWTLEDFHPSTTSLEAGNLKSTLHIVT